MPKVWERKGSDYSILVWESTEPMEELLQKARLNEEDKNKLHGFISESRKREWLTVRNILKTILPENTSPTIRYDVNRKPFIEHGLISISHSHDRVAVMVSEKRRIGIDIEIVGSRIEELAHKFLSEEEIRLATLPCRIEKLHVMWGSKEVMYKIHGIGNIIFKKDLIVYPFEYEDPGVVTGSILIKGYEKDYHIHHQKTGAYMLTWSVE